MVILFICFSLLKTTSDQVTYSLPEHPQNTETRTGVLSPWLFSTEDCIHGLSTLRNDLADVKLELQSETV